MLAHHSSAGEATNREYPRISPKFAHNEDGPLPDVIQHVDVPIITNNECEKMYKNAGYIEEIPDMFICAGISKGGRDSCEGDSGGPLTMVDHDGRSYLVGIISWGIGEFAFFYSFTILPFLRARISHSPIIIIIDPI